MKVQRFNKKEILAETFIAHTVTIIENNGYFDNQKYRKNISWQQFNNSF